MKLADIEKAGFIIRAWTISKMKNERRIIAIFNKKDDESKQKYIVSCTCSNVLLSDTEFTEPVELV